MFHGVSDSHDRGGFADVGERPIPVVEQVRASNRRARYARLTGSGRLLGPRCAVGIFHFLWKLAISPQSVALGSELVAMDGSVANPANFVGGSQSSPSAQAEHPSMALDVRLVAVDRGGADDGAMQLRYISQISTSLALARLAPHCRRRFVSGAGCDAGGGASWRRQWWRAAPNALSSVQKYVKVP